MNISEMSLPDLRLVLQEFPWFPLAHIELVRRISPVDSGTESELERAALHVWSRGELYRIVRERSGKVDFSDSDITDQLRLEMSGRGVSGHGSGKQGVIVVGGDYFSSEDLDEVSSQDRNLSFLDRLATSQDGEVSDQPSGRQFDDFQFYTETLAKIYAQQGYFDRAKEVYTKLILLYPEKSAYFASLIENLKQ